MLPAVSDGHSRALIGRESHVRTTPLSWDDARVLVAPCSVGLRLFWREDVVRAIAGDETSSRVQLRFKLTVALLDCENIYCYETLMRYVRDLRIIELVLERVNG